MPRDRALLVSLKPVYAELILAGTKTVELRRVRPNVEPGAKVWLYASSPVMEIVGTACVAAVHVDEPDRVWTEYGSATGIDLKTYSAYFAGSASAVALELSDVHPLNERLPLAELRRRIRGFRPPQSFRYLGSREVAAIA